MTHGSQASLTTTILRRELEIKGLLKRKVALAEGGSALGALQVQGQIDYLKRLNELGRDRTRFIPLCKQNSRPMWAMP